MWNSIGATFSCCSSSFFHIRSPFHFVFRSFHLLDRFIAAASQLLHSIPQGGHSYIHAYGCISLLLQLLTWVCLLQDVFLRHPWAAKLHGVFNVNGREECYWVDDDDDDDLHALWTIMKISYKTVMNLFWALSELFINCNFVLHCSP